MLIDKDLYGGELPYTDGMIPVCSRSGDIIEPQLTEQWFMKTDEMHQQTQKLIEDGEVWVLQLIAVIFTCWNVWVTQKV